MTSSLLPSRRNDMKDRSKWKSTKLTKARRKPGELATKATAIYNQCRECIGWDREEYSNIGAHVKACPNADCELWSFRVPGASKAKAIAAQGQNETPHHHIEKGTQTGRALPVVTRAKAIKDFCGSCQCIKAGASREPIRECLSPRCHLYPLRLDKLDKDGVAL